VFESPSKKPVRAPAADSKHRQTARFGRLFRKLWWAVLLLVVAIGIFTWRFGNLGKTSTLKLRVQHSFKSADIAVFVDGQQAYKGKLNAQSRRRFGFRDNAQGSLSRNISLTPGKHVVRVQINSPAEDYSERSETLLDFVSGSDRVLIVTADTRSMRMASQTPGSSPTDAAPSWYHSYFASLSLTISGSVVSALFGYLMQQLIATFRKDKLEPPTSQP
jgi:hypothetical protein